MYSDAGHRERVKERFRREGLDHFADVHVLELLLFYAVPRKDTKELARKLLNHFGSFAAVLEASAAELEAVPGVGRNVATYLTLLNATGRYYLVEKADREIFLDSTEKYGNYLLQRFHGRRMETVFLLCMDAKCKVLGCQCVGEGDVNSANIPIRRMVEIALATNATTVVLAHNHPSGLAIPSREDVLTTQQLASALGAMDILLADHIVVADGDFVSIVQSGYYDPREFMR